MYVKKKIRKSNIIQKNKINNNYNDTNTKLINFFKARPCHFLVETKLFFIALFSQMLGSVCGTMR